MLDDRQLDQRKAAILRAVVQQYIETAQPVGSSTVSAREAMANTSGSSAGIEAIESSTPRWALSSLKA